MSLFSQSNRYVIIFKVCKVNHLDADFTGNVLKNQPLGATEYFLKVARPYRSLPAESGERDSSLCKLCSRIDLRSPRLVLDFGCGRGRLLSALLKTKSPLEIGHLRYVGIDLDPHTLTECETYFVKHCAPYGAKGSFADREHFSIYAFLADYIILVFAIHEFDFLNLDIELGYLWHMLRRGGSLLVQDAEVPIHEEVEYICLVPEDIKAILRRTGALFNVERVIAGRRRVPVFILDAQKPLTQDWKDAYGLWRFTEEYLEVLHRSLLKDCWAFRAYRCTVEEGRPVDTTELAMLSHRIAVKARAFHQGTAFKVVEEGASYCLVCGSNNVGEAIDPSDVKTPAWREIRCRDCGYVHGFAIPDMEWRSFEPVLRLFGFLDGGFQPDPQDAIKYATDYSDRNAGMKETVGFLLERIPYPGIARSLLSSP